MTPLELFAEVREDLLADHADEGSIAGYSGERQLRRFLERAQDQACLRSDRMIYDISTSEVCEITPVEGQMAYDFHNSIFEIQKVIYDGHELYHLTKERLDNDDPRWRSRSDSHPTAFFVKGRKLYLYPTPASVTGKTIYLEVLRRPLTRITSSVNDDLLGTELLEIPEDLQPSLRWYMGMMAFRERDEDLGEQDRMSLCQMEFERVFGAPKTAQQMIHRLESPKYGFIGNVTPYLGAETTTTTVYGLGSWP